MTETAGPGGVDTDDMISVHRVFRSALNDAPRLIAGTSGDGRDRVAPVADFLADVLAFLHAHHEGEDEVIIPRLLERSDDGDEIRRIAGQHEEVQPALAAAEASLQAWRDSPGPETAETAAAAIATLAAELTRHLDEEEAEILPLCAELLTGSEWALMPGTTLRAFRGDKVWLILGLIREQMSERQKANMLANMPPPLVETWTMQGSPAFDAFVATLRGGSPG